MSGALHFLVQLLRAGLGVGLWAGSAYGWGSLAVQAIGLRDRDRAEFWLYSTSLGLGVLAHLGLLLGTARLFTFWGAALALGAGLALALIDLVRRRRAAWESVRRAFRGLKFEPFSALLVALLALNLAYSLGMNALVPPNNWDEVAYHLAIPKIYIQSHGIAYIPFIPYANWPLETEMLFTFGLLLGSETLAHLVTWLALGLIALALYAFARPRFGGQVGLLAAAIFSGTPMVTTLAGTGLIELPLSLYTLLAVLALLAYLETHDLPAFILSALFGGLAAATKLNAALTPLLLGVFLGLVIWSGRREKFWPAIKIVAVYGLIAFAVVAPWYLKTWIQTGSPFWPFLYNLLGGRNWDALGSEYLFGFIRSPNLPINLKNWLLALWELSAHPLKFGPYRVTLGWFYLALLPAAIPALFSRRLGGRKTALWLGALGLVFFTAFFFQTHQTRFLMPAATVLALLAALGASWLWSLVDRRAWKVGIQIALILALVALHWTLNSRDRQELAANWPYLSGRITRRQFLEQRIRGYDAFAYANKNLPAEAGVFLALYESRGYYLDHKYLWGNPISQRFLKLETFADSAALAEALHRLGNDYFLVQPETLDTYAYIRYGRHHAELIRSLAAEHGALLYATPDLQLYRLVR